MIGATHIMGMYTEAVIKVTFTERNLPDVVRSVLENLFNGGDKPEELPEHPFFTTPRWEHIGNSSSYYHHPEAVVSYNTSFGGIHLFARFDLKNYDGEIALFFDWVRPYIDQKQGECIGWSWYEEESSPTLIYASQSEDTTNA